MAEIMNQVQVYGIPMSLSCIKSERKLNIVHISTLEKEGGAARVAWRLYNAQRTAGHRSFMLVGAKTTADENICLIPKEIDPDIQSLCQRDGWLYYGIQSSHRLFDHPLIKACDIIHLHNLHGNYFNPFSLAVLGRFKPVVWTLHDMQSITGHCAHSFNCDKWQYGCGDCPYLTVYPSLPVDSSHRLLADKKQIYDHTPFQVTTPSSWLFRKVAKSILSDHPAELIYNGVNTDVFKIYNKIEMRKRFNLPENAVIIGGVANGGALRNGWKGGLYTVAAIKALVAQVPNCLFLSIGAGGESGHPQIINVPAVNDENDLARLYSTLDIYLMTSIAENCPLVVLEAMACGVPVVAFATGGVPELVEDGKHGFIAAPKNLAMIVRALLILSNRSDLRKSFGFNARQRALSMFDHELIARRFEILYHRYINRWYHQNEATSRLPSAKIPQIVKSRVFLDAFEILDNSNYDQTPAGCRYR